MEMIDLLLKNLAQQVGDSKLRESGLDVGIGEA